MIGVYNHLLSKVFSFHYHPQKVIGSLGNITNGKHTGKCHCLRLVLLAFGVGINKQQWLCSRYGVFLVLFFFNLEALFSLVPKKLETIPCKKTHPLKKKCAL